MEKSGGSMLKNTMIVGALMTVLGFTGFVLCLPATVSNVNGILTSYREEYNKTEPIYEIDNQEINQIRFFGDINVRLLQSEDEMIRVYRVSKRAKEDNLKIVRTWDTERAYLNITGTTEKYSGMGLLDRLFSLINDQVYEEITVYIPKTVEISASGLNGELFGVLNVEYLNSYAGSFVEPEETITLEEIRQRHLAVEQNLLQYEFDLDTLEQRYREGKNTKEEYDDGREEQIANISYELEKVVRMLASFYQLTEQHITLVMDSVGEYLDAKYAYRGMVLQGEMELETMEEQGVSPERIQQREEELQREEQEAKQQYDQAKEALHRYENIYLGGFDLVC